MTTEATEPQSFLDLLRQLKTDRLFVHVDVGRVLVDTGYQRKVDMQRVRKMAAVYDEKLMGVIVCSVREDGGVYVIDGQHRLELARLLGHETVRCELRSGLTIPDEARMFHALDTARTGLGGDDLFRALLIAEDQTALAIKQAVEDAGLRISFTGPLIGAVRAYKTLLKLVGQYGIDAVRQTLKVLHDAWPESITPAPAGVLEGMTPFLLAYPDIDQKELSRALSKHSSPERLINNARAISGSMSWNTKTSMQRAILSAYNSSRSTGRLDDRIA